MSYGVLNSSLYMFVHVAAPGCLILRVIRNPESSHSRQRLGLIFGVLMCAFTVDWASSHQME